jgi:hypothetical protein
MVVGALVFLAVPAMAHWFPDDPADPQDHKMHWAQMPDLQTGVDVLASVPNPIPPPPDPVFGGILADDFQCTQSGPIRDIHIWAWWLNNVLPTSYDPGTGQRVPDPGNVGFQLRTYPNTEQMPM